MKTIFTTEELVTMLAVSESTLLRWQREGSFPMRLKLGKRKVGFLRADVERWLQSRNPAMKTA